MECSQAQVRGNCSPVGESPSQVKRCAGTYQPQRSHRSALPRRWTGRPTAAVDSVGRLCIAQCHVLVGAGSFCVSQAILQLGAELELLLQSRELNSAATSWPKIMQSPRWGPLWGILLWLLHPKASASSLRKYSALGGREVSQSSTLG